MNRFSFPYLHRKLGVILIAVTALQSAQAAEVAPAPRAASTVKNPASNAPNLTREFSVVPNGDALYSALEAVRRAGWSGLASEASTSSPAAGLTRYEMAMETAKAIVTVRARAKADTRWASTIAARAPEATRGLRALCIAFAPELARFDAGANAMAAQLSLWLAAPAPEKFSTDFSTATREDSFGKFSASTAAAPNAQPALNLPLSQRLRVYAAVNSLMRAQADPFQHDLNSSFTQSDAGVALSLGHRVRVRAGVSNRDAGSGSDSRGASASDFFAPSFSQQNFSRQNFSEQSFGGGLDLALRENMVLSGEVARVHSQRMGFDNWLSSPAGRSFNGTKIEGGLSMSGWQNRVALSAHLSRLVPEDSLALATTAAQLNLDFGLSQQVSLNLLYRQLFETSQTPRGNRVFGGGFNINF